MGSFQTGAFWFFVGVAFASGLIWWWGSRKPKFPSELEMLTAFGWEKLDRGSNQVAHVAHVVYSYIARKILA